MADDKRRTRRALSEALADAFGLRPPRFATAREGLRASADLSGARGRAGGAPPPRDR